MAKRRHEIQAVVADPEIAVRRALRLLLMQELSFHVVREAATPTGLQRQIQRIRPDILVVDWSLIAAGSDGLLSMLREQCPDLRVLALHVRAEVRDVALASGADRFVGKGEGPDQIIQALQTLCSTR